MKQQSTLRYVRQHWRRLLLIGLPLVFALLTVLQVLLLSVINPPTTAFMLARQWEAWRADEADFRLHYHWRDGSELSPYVGIALVAAEDQTFLQHHGFDVKAISQAMSRNQQGGRVRGASTISQQVAKNLFLWRGRSWLRKGLEAWYTVLIEAIWSKQRILEVYANIAEFGDGIYGVEAAAQQYFGMSAAQLNLPKSALLAAVLPSPRRYSVRAPGPYVQRRAAWIQRQVRQLGGPDALKSTP